MKNLLQLALPISVEKSSEEDGPLKITGYANTTTKDRQGDVVPEEAWKKGALSNYAKNPIILAFHDHKRPVGKATGLEVDKGGLKITAEISKHATEVYNLIKDGILKAFSIGFLVKDADYDPKTDIFVIKDLELLEVSVVSVPANQDSLFELAKQFESPEEYSEFKKSFCKSVEQTETQVSKGDILMDNEALQKLLRETAEATANAVTDAMTKKAEDEAAAKAAADKAEADRQELIKLGQSGAEKLVEDVSKKLEGDVTDIRKAVGDLANVVKEQAEAFAKAAATQRDRGFDFSDKGDGKNEPSMDEKATAVLVAKAMKSGIEATKYYGQLKEKYGAHVPSAYWEDQVSTAMQEEIQRRLVVEPVFTNLNMPSSILRLPLNPEAGYGTWVATTSYGTTDSSGAAGTHVLKEITVTAYKLATKEFLTYEEEDDALIALMPIVRDALVRRMAKSRDKAFLRGVGSGADPLKGIASWAGTAETATVATTAKVAVSDLVAARKKLGVWGLDPSDLVYFVSTEAYYDLLEDSNFQTVDKIGNDRATLRNGQIGVISGSPVIVSGEYAAKASAAVAVTVVAPRNFLAGRYKGLMIEQDRLIEKQQNLLVATQRLAFQQLTSVDGNGTSIIKWS